MDFEGMTAAQVDQLIKELTMYAVDKARRKIWRGARGESPREGSDYVVDALVGLRTGERARNRARYPLLRDQLKAIIDSLVSGDVTSITNKQERRADDNPGPMGKAAASDTAVDELVADTEQARLIKAALEDQIVDDDELVEVFDIMERYGEYESADLQRRLGKDKCVVDNLRKKFRRALLKATAAVEGGSHV